MQETLSVNSCSAINQIHRSGDFGPSTQVRWCMGLPMPATPGHSRGMWPQQTAVMYMYMQRAYLPRHCTALGCQHSSTIRNHGNSLKEAGFHMKTLQLNYKVTLPIISSHILPLSAWCHMKTL